MDFCPFDHVFKDDLGASPFRVKYFRRIQKRLRVNKTTLKSPWPSCTCKGFWHIIRIRLNAFGVFSHYDKTFLPYSRNMQKELRIRWNKFALLTCKYVTCKYFVIYFCIVFRICDIFFADKKFPFKGIVRSFELGARLGSFDSLLKNRRPGKFFL